MAPRFVALARELRQELAAFEPALFAGAECAAVAEALARTEKACGAARAPAAARAADCGEHRKKGFADPEDWAARMSGSSTHQARTDLDTARRLEDCDKTRQAVLDGGLSLGQAWEITRTEAECPGSEDELLDTARRQGLGTPEGQGPPQAPPGPGPRGAAPQAAARPGVRRLRRRAGHGAHPGRAAARDRHGLAEPPRRRDRPSPTTGKAAGPGRAPGRPRPRRLRGHARRTRPGQGPKRRCGRGL